MSPRTVPTVFCTGWRGTFRRKRAGSRKEACLKVRLWALPASAAEPTLAWRSCRSPLPSQRLRAPRAEQAVGPADATRAQLLEAMKDIIVGKAAYVGRFKQ
jgi:hypothetical protein